MAVWWCVRGHVPLVFLLLNSTAFSCFFFSLCGIEECDVVCSMEGPVELRSLRCAVTSASQELECLMWRLLVVVLATPNVDSLEIFFFLEVCTETSVWSSFAGKEMKCWFFCSGFFRTCGGCAFPLCCVALSCFFILGSVQKENIFCSPFWPSDCNMVHYCELFASFMFVLILYGTRTKCDGFVWTSLEWRSRFFCLLVCFTFFDIWTELWMSICRVFFFSPLMNGWKCVAASLSNL